MKKIIFALASILMLTVSACSSKADPAAIHEKIEKGQDLSQSDYSVIIDYVIEANEAVVKAIQNAKTVEDMTKFQKQYYIKYPYLTAYQAVLSNDEDKLDKENLKKLEKLSDITDKQLEAFNNIDFLNIEDE